MPDDLRDRDWLLVPGTLCTGAVFDGLLDALAVPGAQRRTVALDRPRVQDYARAFDGVGPGTVVCGFSLGAILAAHFADRMRADALILFGATAAPDDPGNAPARRALADDVARLGGGAALASRLPPAMSAEARRRVLGMADAMSAAIEAQTALASGRPGAADALRRAACPVTALAGTLDAQTPFARAAEIAAMTPRGRSIPLPGLGHYALIEDPGACAAALGDHRATTHAARGIGR